MRSSKNEISGLKKGEAVYSQIREKTFFTLLERIFVPIITFLISVYVIRTLSIEDYGIYNVLIAIMQYVAFLSSLGIPNVFDRFIPEFFQKGEIAKLKKVVQKGMLWMFLLSLGIVLAMIIFSKEVAMLFKLGNAFRYLVVFSVGIIFFLQAALFSRVLISIFHHKQFFIAKLIYVVFRGLLLYFLLDFGAGLMGLLIGESIAYMVWYIIFYLFYREFLKKNLCQEKGEFPLKRLIKFGGYSYFSEAGHNILSVASDYFIISAVLGPQAVGIYAFGAHVVFLASRLLPHVAFINVIKPVFFARYSQNNDPKQIRSMFKILIKITAFLHFL